MKATHLVAAIMLVGGGAASVHAQEARRLTLDVTGGFGTALHSSVDYASPPAVAGEVTLMRRSSTRSVLVGVLGLTAGGQTQLGISDVCLYRDGVCAPHVPAFYHVGLMGGAEYRAGGVPVRLTAGPAVYVGPQRSGAGAQVQLDLASPTVGRVALVVSARTSLVARFDGERIQLGALGAGLRIQ